eukprot:m.112135 g.112135  ORF g.112135 m.112135 type:complete len:381 (-) comp12777_c2_seq1:2053-3195(-)
MLRGGTPSLRLFDNVLKACRDRFSLSRFGRSYNSNTQSFTAQAKRFVHQMGRGSKATRGPEPHHTGPSFWKKSIRFLSTSTIFKKMFFDAPIPVLFGISIGGLGASIAGTIFVLHQANVIDAIDFMDRFKHNTTPVGEEATKIHDVASGIQVGSFHFPIPFPLVTVLGWTLFFSFTLSMAFLRSKYQLRYREFLHQVNFSLTSVGKDKVLRLRTLQEGSIESVIGENSHAVNMIVDGARSLTKNSVFVPLPAEDSDLIMNQMLNYISPHFSRGFIAEDMGIPVKQEWYYFGITFNPQAVRMRKLRVVIASESLLKDMAANCIPKPAFESEDHEKRWTTLCEMASLVKQQGFDGPAIIRESGADKVIRVGKLHVVLPVPIS